MKTRIKFCLFLGLLTASAVSPARAESPKLIRHFTFDQGYNESTSGIEPTQIIGEPTFVSGISGQGILLDGASAVAYDDYFDLQLKQFTLTAWIYFEDKEQRGNIAGTGSDIYWIFFNHGEVKSGFYDTKFHECHSGIYLQPKQWYFLAISYDGKTLRAYINQHLDCILKIESAPRPLEQSFIIGAEGTTPPSYYFKGIIDEVRLYDGPVPTAELLKLYRGGLARP